MDDTLACLGGFEAFEIAVGKDGALGGHEDGAPENRRCRSGLHWGYRRAMSTHVLPNCSMCTEIQI